MVPSSSLIDNPETVFAQQLLPQEEELRLVPKGQALWQRDFRDRGDWFRYTRGRGQETTANVKAFCPMIEADGCIRMKVVVFGAAGWTGRAVLANLAGRHEVRAALRAPESWSKWKDIDGEWHDGEVVYGDITDFSAVHAATDGMDAIIHLYVHFPGDDDNDDRPFLVNVKGLWNVLESARRRGIRRVVHVGSCQSVHPEGIYFTSEVRRPDGTLYAVCKRLQEEMCRQFYEAHGLRVIVLRPDYIVDTRLGIDFERRQLGEDGTPIRCGAVCRHDFAEACRLAMESETIDFDVLHIVGTPEAKRTCNVARAARLLGLTYKGDLDKYQ